MGAFQIFTQPSQQALDTAANVLSGATLTFTLTGTSTPTNAYSDSALTTPVANPLSANSAGVFIPVFLDPLVTYRIVLKSQAGVVLQTWDPANENVLSQSIIGQYLFPRTSAEIAALITPSSYAFRATPVAEAARYGFSTAASASANTTAITNAIAALPLVGSIQSGTVLLPPGEFSVNQIAIPQYVTLRGAGSRATQLDYSGTGFCITLGNLNGLALKYGCGVTDLAIVLSNKDGHGVTLQETASACVQRLYIEGYTSSVTTRTNIGVQVDGGGFSAFSNDISDVVANHIRVGFKITTTGAQRPTAQYISNCLAFGDDSTYGQSIGIQIDGSCGDGSLFVGCNLEHLRIGINAAANSLSFTAVGLRFEGNFVDAVAGGGTQQPSTFIACQSDTEFNFSDNANLFTCLGNATLSSGPWVNRLSGSLRGTLAQLTYTASVTPSVQYSNEQSLNVTNATAFTINAPTGVVQDDGFLLRITIRNSSGGALGAVTWNAIYKLAAWTQPANGFSRSIQFRYDGVNWIEVSRTTVDVPN